MAAPTTTGGGQPGLRRGGHPQPLRSAVTRSFARPGEPNTCRPRVLTSVPIIRYSPGPASAGIGTEIEKVP